MAIQLHSPCSCMRFQQLRYFKNLWRKPLYDPVADPNPPWSEPLVGTIEGEPSEPYSAQESVPSKPWKLHAVCQVKPASGRPYWEKDALNRLGMGEDGITKGKLYKYTVLKNTPSNNRLLQIVKHLVKIQPVTFPYGMPSSPEDYKYCQLNENGEFRVVQKLQSEAVDVPAEQRELEENPEKSKWRMDNETLKKHSRYLLANKLYLWEHFPATYRWTRNQDGQEFRYSKDTPENRELRRTASVNAHVRLKKPQKPEVDEDDID